MPTDPIPTTPSTPPTLPVPPKKKTPSQEAESHYDQAQLQTVRNGETIATQALDPAYNAALLAEGMRATAPSELTAAGAAWRQLSQEAIDATNAIDDAVGTGNDAETAVRHDVDYIRSKARLKITQNPSWTETQIQALTQRYLIGEDIFANEATAGETVQTMLDRATTDALPGLTPAKLATFATHLAAFNAKPVSKTGQQAIATQKRKARGAKFIEIMRLRHEIQHAADGAWPWSIPGNNGLRMLFKLPAGRPFTG
jgi:hypothetical protein